MIEALEKAYEGNMENIDLYIGGMLETETDGRPGPLFRKIIKEQFERLRDSDRFWFENTANGYYIIHSLSFDSILRNTLIFQLNNITIIHTWVIQYLITIISI